MSCIIASLFATNVLKRFFSLFIYPRTIIESVQKYLSCIVSSNSFVTNLYNLTESTAAASSSLGIDIALIGANLDFPMTRLHFLLPFTS